MDLLDIKYAKLLAQSFAPNNSAYAIYTPVAGAGASIRFISICNTSNAAATYDIYVDANGNTFANTTAVCFGTYLQPYSTDFIEFPNPGLLVTGQAGGNLGVKSNTANVLTFTVGGFEVK